MFDKLIEIINFSVNNHNHHQMHDNNITIDLTTH